MKKTSLLSIFTVSILIVFTACNRADKDAILVPIDAAFVLHLNTNSLSEKMSWADVKNSAWFNQASSKQEDSLTKRILDDPDNSGMDTKKGFVLFAKRVGSSAGYFGISGTVKDAAAFESFNKKTSKSETVTKDGDHKSIRFENDGVVSWDGNRFLYLFNAPFGAMNNMNTRTPDFNPDDTGTVAPPVTDYEEPVKLDLPTYVRNIFNYKNDSLLISDARFKDLINEKGDVHVWFSAEHLYGGGAGMMGMLSFLKADVYFKESITAATLDFDDGKIAIRSKSYSNKEMSNLYKKYSGNKINADLVKRIPSDNVIAVFSVNYPPEGLKAFLQIGGLDGMINSQIGQMNLTIDDFVAANKGDLMVSVTDFTIKDKVVKLEGMDPIVTKSPDVNILFVTTIGNKAAFDKLVEAGKKITEKQPGMAANISYSLNNELFVAGNNQQLIDAYIKGGSKDHAFLSKINGHPMGAYLDLQKLITGLNTTMNRDSTTPSPVYDASIALWKDVVMTGGEFKNDAFIQDVEVNLVDQKTNSLKQLNAYFNTLSASNKRGF